MRLRTLLLLLVLGCASSDPALVPVIGAPGDLTPLTGEWTGTYESRMTGRSGSITFHLTDDPKGAHGDVLFLPQTSIVVNEHMEREIAPAAVLNIAFVRVAAGEINGRIAPYPDPEEEGVVLETHFSGHVNGQKIEGTFVTYASNGVAPRRGTWNVRRKAA